MSKARFLAWFLIYFALLLVLWSFTPAAAWWQRLMLGIGGYVGAAVHGWILEAGAGGRAYWVNGDARVPLAMQFEALSVGIVPTLALLLATPESRWSRRAAQCVVAVLTLLLIHVLVIVLFPLLTYHKNAATDVLGLFLGLVAFVGAPVIIWFALTLDRQRQWLPALRR